MQLTYFPNPTPRTHLNYWGITTEASRLNACQYATGSTNALKNIKVARSIKSGINWR